jgi:hypothetical protein
MTKHPEYRGVYIRTAPRPSPYFARVNRKGLFIFSEYFREAEGAARAYDRIVTSIRAAKGKTILNFPDAVGTPLTPGETS